MAARILRFWRRMVCAVAIVAARAAAAAPVTFTYTQAGHAVTVRYFSPGERREAGGEGREARSHGTAGAEETPRPTWPVVIVMHGVGRNGLDYYNDWEPQARAHGFVLIVPEFSKQEFPGVEGYNYGNTVAAGRVAAEAEGMQKAGYGDPALQWRRREEWAFAMIEPIFDAVQARTGNQARAYRLFGHSAGAQFVQRFIYFIPNARVERVVAANAGWYMLPELATAFPYGLAHTPVTEADLRHALALPVTILLGTADVDPEAKSLRHTREADTQGLFRYARGQYFLAHGAAAARALRCSFGWRLATAPGVAHSDRDIAPHAATELFRP